MKVICWVAHNPTLSWAVSHPRLRAARRAASLRPSGPGFLLCLSGRSPSLGCSSPPPPGRGCRVASDIKGGEVARTFFTFFQNLFSLLLFICIARSKSSFVFPFSYFEVRALVAVLPPVPPCPPPHMCVRKKPDHGVPCPGPRRQQRPGEPPQLPRFLHLIIINTAAHAASMHSSM